MDVLVRREKDGEFTTSVYRKSSHSDCYLNFWQKYDQCGENSACYYNYVAFFYWSSSSAKDPGLQSLKYRDFACCSNVQLLTAELNHLKKTFLMNGYPSWLIDNILSGTKLLTEKILQQSDSEQQINEQKMRLAIQAV